MVFQKINFPFLFSSMQNWHSFYIYPLDTLDICLLRAVRPFLAQYIWPETGARAFFIRYEDADGPHLRLRLRGEQPYMEQTVIPAFYRDFEGKGTIKEVPYVAETARFGGEESMALAEEHFHISSRVVLERMARQPYVYGDAMFDAMRMQLIVYSAAGFDDKKIASYAADLLEQWLPLYFQGEAGTDWEHEIKAAFGQHFTPQKAALKGVLDPFWYDLQKGRVDMDQLEWVRWVRGNQLIFKALDSDAEKILPSLLHLNNNRLGINNQDEVYLNYIITEVMA